MKQALSLKGFLANAVRPFAGMTREINCKWRQFWSFAHLNAQVANLDPSVVVLEAPEIHGTREIEFGRNLYLYRNLYLETRAHGTIRIGDGVVLSRGVHLVAYAGIEIGEGSMIGEYSSLRDANHRYGVGVAPRYSGHEAQPIRIGRNVWIGRGVTVLPGVTIGESAVIGANAVVTHDVPAGSIVGGVPARPIRKEIH